jgi:hypothetical protein
MTDNHDRAGQRLLLPWSATTRIRSRGRPLADDEFATLPDLTFVRISAGNVRQPFIRSEGQTASMLAGRKGRCDIDAALGDTAGASSVAADEGAQMTFRWRTRIDATQGAL